MRLFVAEAELFGLLLQYDGTKSLAILLQARETIAADKAFKADTARLAEDTTAAQARIVELQALVAAKVPGGVPLMNDASDESEEIMAWRVNELKQQVEGAMLSGQTVACPGCKIPVEKGEASKHCAAKHTKNCDGTIFYELVLASDDACMHMTCACGIHFCYVCGKESGPHQDEGHYAPRLELLRCPKGSGCDEISLYIEGNPGWQYFSITQAESDGEGAKHEFHRRVM